MKDKLTSIDIRYIASGYFMRFFEYRFYPKVKWPWLTALITLIAGVGLAFAFDIEDPVNIGVAAIAIGLLIVAIICFVKGWLDYQGDKEEFLDVCRDKWHENQSIPSMESLKEYLKSKGTL